MFDTIRQAVEYHRAAHAASEQLYLQLRVHREETRTAIDHLRMCGHNDLERALATESATYDDPVAHARYRKETDALLQRIEEASQR